MLLGLFGWSDGDIYGLYGELDLDDDGSISFNEFMQGMVNVSLFPAHGRTGLLTL